MKTKSVLLYISLFVLIVVGCHSEKSEKLDAKIIQEGIREILNAKELAKHSSDIVGVWQGDNSEVILFIDDSHRVMVVNVADIGELQKDDKGNINIKRTVPNMPEKVEYFGTIIEGKIIRQQYDYKESFLRKQ